jgi:hypothetical protein
VPANDDFARRYTLTGAQAHAEGFNYGATCEPEEPTPLLSGVAATLWWTWTAPGSGPATIDLAGSSFDTHLAVYQGSSLSSLLLVAANDDATFMAEGLEGFASRLTFAAQGGATYQIQVGSATAERGLVELSLLGPTTPPPGLVSVETVPETGSFVLRLHGVPGQEVFIESSSDLVNWQAVGALRFVSAGAVWQRQIEAEIPIRFFRLVSPR